jgi:multiple sugar transport system ATP-binding protein
MALELKGISKSFGGSGRVLDNVDLSVPTGEFLSLLGPSGCGKSTLLRVIAGLLEQDSGEVWLDQKQVDGASPKARDIAMVFQTYALYPHMSAFDNIAVPLRMRRLKLADRIPLLRHVTQNKVTLAEIRSEVAAAAKLLGIEALLPRKPGQLSGGQRQRVAIGRAIVRRPRVFLMDEPLSNLDAALRVQMQSELIDLHQKLQTTILYVTHDQAEAMTMSHRIAVIFDGRILQLDTPSRIYDNPNHIRVARFIGTPEINVLPGTVLADSKVEVNGAVLPLDVGKVAPGPIQFGFRPESAKLSTPKGQMFSGTATLALNLGSEVLLTVVLDGFENARVTLRLHPHEEAVPERGSQVHLKVDFSRCLLFDANGVRIPVVEAQSRERIYA